MFTYVPPGHPRPFLDPAQQPPAAVREIHADAALKVLFVDDGNDPALLAFLASEGLCVSCAETGATAVAMATAGAYHVIVLDLHLPDINGLTLLERLRAAGLSSPVLVVTGYYLDAEIETHARAAGATAFRFKPLWPEDFAHVLRALADGTAVFEDPRSARSFAAASAAAADDSRCEDEMIFRRLLARLDRFAGQPSGVDAESGERSKERLLTWLLGTLANHRLTLDGLIGCSAAVRTVLHAPPASSSQTLAAAALTAAERETRRWRTPLNPRVRRVLDILMTTRVKWSEADLALRVGTSPSHLGRLLHDETHLKYRDVRRYLLMQAAVVEVLTTDEQIAQIAHRLHLHPGHLDREFSISFGTSPRELRRLWKALCD